MSTPADYEKIEVSSVDASVRVDITWGYSSLSELYVWYQNTVTGEVLYEHLGDFVITEHNDMVGDYILVENATGQIVDISVTRKTAQTQTYELSESQALNPASLEEALDKQMRLAQENSLAIGAGDDSLESITSVNPFEIADKVTRAGRLQGYDENGDPVYKLIDEAIDDAVGYAEEWANKDEDSLISASAGGNQIDDYSALHHATKASASEGNASTSETNATASEAKANEWAEQDEDVEVETGEFSSKHWAKKAEASSVEGKAILLSTIDMTNGGADDVYFLDFIHTVSWDAFDYLDIVVENAQTASSTTMGLQVRLASVGEGSSGWKDLDGTPTQSSIIAGSQSQANEDVNLRIRLGNKGTKKSGLYTYVAYNGSNFFFIPEHTNNQSSGLAHPNSGLVADFNTVGGYSAHNYIAEWNGWDTGSDYWTDFRLRFASDLDFFTKGEIRLYGVNL